MKECEGLVFNSLEQLQSSEPQKYKADIIQKYVSGDHSWYVPGKQLNIYPVHQLSLCQTTRA